MRHIASPEDTAKDRELVTRLTKRQQDELQGSLLAVNRTRKLGPGMQRFTKTPRQGT